MPGGNPNQVLPRKECLVPASLRAPPGDPPSLWFNCGAQPCESSGAPLQIVLQAKDCLPATGDAGIQRAATGQTEYLYMAAGGIHFSQAHVIFSLMNLHPVLLREQGRGLVLPVPGGCSRCLCDLCSWRCTRAVVGVLRVPLPAANASLPPCWLDSGIWLFYHILKCPL